MVRRRYGRSQGSDQDEYKKTTGTLDEGKSYSYGEYDEEGNRDIVGVAAYLISYSEWEYLCYYPGSWKSGMRKGQADWMEYDEFCEVIGYGNAVAEIKEGKMVISEFHT